MVAPQLSIGSTAVTPHDRPPELANAWHDICNVVQGGTKDGLRAAVELGDLVGEADEGPQGTDHRVE